jgi:hypothetical protein
MPEREMSGEIGKDRIADLIAKHVPSGSAVELRTTSESKIDWTDENAPQGSSVSTDINIEFRVPGGEWDGFLADSDSVAQAVDEMKHIKDALERMGYTVKIVTE